jgi:predicted secreted protein
MSSIRTLLAAAALVGLSGATAFATPLTVVSQGENFSVQYDAGYTGNIVGGGTVRIAGQGESQVIAYSDPSFANRSAGIPVFTGGSEGSVAYLPADASASQLAVR